MNEEIRVEAPGTSRRNFLLGSAGVGAFALLGLPALSGCSTDTAGGKSTAIVAIPDALTTLESPLMNSVNVAAAVRHVIESFVSLDATGKVIPALAESWKVASDKVTWTMNLRKGVKFHDGSPWTASVAKQNIDRYLGNPSLYPRAQIYGFIKKTTVIDEHTLELRTAAPISDFINWMSFIALGFQSGPSIDKYGTEAGLHGVGTGPFKVVKFVPNQELQTARFDDYWGPKPLLEKVTFTTVPDASSRVSQLQAGQIQVTTPVAPPQIPSIKGDSSATLQTVPSVRMVFIGINCQNQSLGDLRVRKAFNYAVDAVSILKSVLNGQGTIAKSVMAEMIPGYAPQPAYEFDPSKAEQLLDEAGWRKGSGGKRGPNGKPITLTLRTTDGNTPGDRLTAQAVQNYLANIGVDSKILILDQNKYFADLEAPSSIKTTDLNYFAYGPNTVSPTHALTLFQGNWSNVNSVYARYRNPKFDAAYQQILTTVDNPAEKVDATKRAQSIAWNDAPWIFLFSLNYIAAHRDNLTGLEIAPDELYSLASAKLA